MKVVSVAMRILFHPADQIYNPKPHHSSVFVSDEESTPTNVSTEPVPSSSPPGLRRSPHSSSPTLTDYVREHFVFLVQRWTTWSLSRAGDPSSTDAAQGPTSRVTFTLGGPDSSKDERAAAAAVESADFDFLDLPEQASLPHSCVSSMHRTSTMPELRIMPCECQ